MIEQNWKYTIVDPENDETGNINQFDNIEPIENINIGIDLLNYFGFGDKKSILELQKCTPITYVYMKNGGIRKLKDIRFTEMPIMYRKKLVDGEYVSGDLPDRELLIRAIPFLHEFSVTAQKLYIDPKFILVFIDGKYSVDWHCVDTILYFHKKPRKSFEIYLLSNFDYNLQEKTHYYSNQSPEIEFTFNNLRKNQFMEHHLISKDYFIIGTDGISSFIRKDTIQYRHLLKFNNGEFVNSSLVKIRNVVQNQSETYEDVIIRKKIYGNNDYSLWNGVEDIYSTSNSSSTLLFDQYGRLIDPISIDWYNRRLTVYGDGYDYVEIQHPQDIAYTGEIYFPAAGHNADEHIRYNNLYETNYKLVFLENGGTFEYDTYFQKNFETLHLEETIYVKDYTYYVTDGINRYPIRNNKFSVSTNPDVLYDVDEFNGNTMTIDGIEYSLVEESFDIGTALQTTKKGEHLYLDDIILNKSHKNTESDFDEDIITDITSVQIQSDTSFIRREILTSKTFDGYANDLRVEVPKLYNDDYPLFVFVDGQYQFADTYETYTDENTGKHYIQVSNEFAGETPETTESHIVTVFYYNVSNLIYYKNFNVSGGVDDYLIFDNDFNTLLTQFSKMLPGLLLNDNIERNVISVLTYIKWNMDEYGTSVTEDEDKTMCAFGTKAHPILCALAHKLAYNVQNNRNTINGNLVLIKFINNYVDSGLSDSTADKFSLPAIDDDNNVILPDYPSLLDYLVMSFSYVGDDGLPATGEIPLSFIIGNPLFKGLEFDMFFFENNFGDYDGTYNFSIDKGHFNSSEQSFSVNNLRKNIYMEHHNKITASYTKKLSTIYVQHKKNYVHFQTLVNLNPHFITNSLIRMCDKRGYVNNFDTVDNNLYYGSISVRNFVESSIGYNVTLYDHPDWNVDNENLTLSFKYPFDFADDNDILVLVRIVNSAEDELPIDENEEFKFPKVENDEGYIQPYDEELEQDRYYSISEEPLNLVSDEEVSRTFVTVTYKFNTQEQMEEKLIELLKAYIYTKEVTDVFATNNVYKLEQEMNRYSSMLFDNSGYLISPDSIDWVFTEFNYPMEEKTISILPLNSTYPAIIGELYDSSLEKAQIMDLCMNDIIQIDGELHRIGGDLQEGVNLNADTYGWDIAVPENGWELQPNEYDGEEPLRNLYIPPDGYYDDIFAENTGLINYSVVPVDYNITETSQWLYLTNADYVYWTVPTIQDSMRIVVEVDDFIEDNIFVFVNGIKVEDWTKTVRTPIDFTRQADDYPETGITPVYLDLYDSSNNQLYVENGGLNNDGSWTVYVPNDVRPSSFEISMYEVENSNSTDHTIYHTNYDRSALISDLISTGVIIKGYYDTSNNQLMNTSIYLIGEEVTTPYYGITIRAYRYVEETISDVEVNKTKHYYQINHFSKYNKERYCYKKYSRIYGDVLDHFKFLYVDLNDKYTFNETDRYVTLYEDSVTAKAKYLGQNELTDNTLMVGLADEETANEIVIYNYNPEDIQYAIKEQQDRYVFDDYYDYELRKYSLVFVNGIRVRDFIVDGNEIVLDLEETDRLEIYVFKKFDYNWIDEVKYDQYRDKKYFNVHNLKTVRMI